MQNYNRPMNTNDIYELLHKLGIDNTIVIRKSLLKDYLKNNSVSNIIINLDSIGNGTHWVACNTAKKMYFDSYAQPPINAIKDYKYNKTKEIQLLTNMNCGALCCLWLYFVNKKNVDEFYKLFHDLY
jgi:hypothetical protein